MQQAILYGLLLSSACELTLARPDLPRSPAQGHMIHISRGLSKRSSHWNPSLRRRQVPQEHSHEKFLTITNTFLKVDNPDNILDAVFGLLGNAAASAGLGAIPDPDCLQQATADRAFTNAKEAGDVTGMTGALIYRALERNTGAVGQASVLCTAIDAVNPEIAAISQHQDPASDNAAETNKNIVLELAIQIASIGGNPLDALQSGTFAPGEIGDPTAAGNTCNDLDDAEGCIFTLDLLVEDATEDEIIAAVTDAGIEVEIGAGVGGEATETVTDAAPIPTECLIPPPPPAVVEPPAVTDCAAEISSALASFSAGLTATATAVVTKPAPTKGAAATPPAPPPDAGGNGALDLGACIDPAIIFADGLDGRKEKSFIAHNQDNKTGFPHGSAQNIKVITDFICQQLKDKCKAPAATIEICVAAAADAQKAGGKDQGAADAFNAAMGA